MKTPHILNLSNPRKVKTNLSGILDQESLDRIEDEITENAKALFKLGLRHYVFALKQSPPNWRQRVSRLYYAAYNVSRGVRLFVYGTYSTDVKEHQKFYELPGDFPSKARFVNQLEVLREDRNMSDYDHTCQASDLVLGTKQSTALVGDFVLTSKQYLVKRGVKL